MYDFTIEHCKLIYEEFELDLKSTEEQRSLDIDSTQYNRVILLLWLAFRQLTINNDMKDKHRLVLYYN